MYQTVTVEKFSSGGLNTDVPQWGLDQSFITNGVNFRIKDNKILSTYGYAVVSSNTYGTEAGGGTIPSGDTANYPQFFTGHTNGILSITINGAVALSYSAGGLAYDGWTFARLGPILIANHVSYGALYKLNGASSWTRLPFKTAANWGTNGKYGLCIRSHKTYLFMLGLYESSTYLYDSFRWSHPADANAIPASWDETDTAFVAGKAALGAKSKQIIDGYSLKEQFIIYSQESINVLWESGDMNIWNRSEITSSTGLLRRECIAELNGVHFLLCVDDITICDGTGLQSIATGMIQRHMAANIDATKFAGYAFVVANTQEREVWFCVPSTSAPYSGCDLAYVYNIDGSSWAVRDIKGTSNVVMRSAAWGYCPDTNSIYDRSIIAISNTGKAFNLDPVPPVNAYNHEYAGAITVANKDATIERQNLKLSDLDQEIMLVSVRPMLKGKGQVQVYIGSHKYAGANVVWKTPVTFDIRDDDRIPIRCSGKLFAWKIVGLSGAIFELSGIEFEITPAGTR
jgi:hypothetical protein